MTSLLQSKFTKFAKEWGFIHRTSSPKFPQSNGFAEAGVKIMKRCIKKSEDCYEALQNYRATPLENGFSPAELLMGRRIRTSVPMKSLFLEPKTPDKNQLRAKEEQRILNQKRNYDRHHRARDLEEIRPETKVWITDLRRFGTIIKKCNEPRSYMVETMKRQIRRNRVHLIPFRGEENGRNGLA